MENKKTKRFYKVGETVWVVGEKKEGKVKSIDKEKLEVTVEIKEGIIYKVTTLKVWEIDKLKYKAKEELKKDKDTSDTDKLVGILYKTVTPSNPIKISKPKVYFAKVREDAIVPSKREEDAGYDIYSNVSSTNIEGKEIHEIYVPAFTTTLVPTGIAMALPSTHYFNVKHERGSTGKISMSVLAGVVDSGYRGEIFVALTPLHKDVLITSEVTETQIEDNVILYPYSKAIAQATIDLVPQVEIEVIAFEDLSKIESERGATKLGQSGK